MPKWKKWGSDSGSNGTQPVLVYRKPRMPITSPSDSDKLISFPQTYFACLEMRQECLHFVFVVMIGCVMIRNGKHKMWHTDSSGGYDQNRMHMENMSDFPYEMT